LFVIAACKKSGVDGYQLSPDGVLYKNIISTSTSKAKMGDVLTVNFTERTQNDSLLESRHPFQIMVRTAEFKGDPRGSLTMVGVGDSISFMVPIDSLIRVQNPTPAQKAQIAKVVAPLKKHGDYVKLDVKVLDIKSQQDVMNERAAATAKSAEAEKTALPDYLSAHKINAKQTASGLYYSIDKKGTGPLPKPGQKVTVNYTGTMLDGSVFDSSLKPGRTPFTFTLGQGQVIKGWDEGIALLPVGSKAHLFIPSDLAYGEAGNQGIPPNTPLVFEIDVLSVSAK
jgi:FKBP-type peptidyl-prolyl cis-trans isomerase